MSNNRMWLRNVRTGRQILIGKYLPSSGWCVPPVLELDRLQAFFDVNEVPLDERDNPGDGDNEYGVLYEMGEPNEGRTVKCPKTGWWRAKP